MRASRFVVSSHNRTFSSAPGGPESANVYTSGSFYGGEFNAAAIGAGGLRAFVLCEGRRSPSNGSHSSATQMTAQNQISRHGPAACTRQYQLARIEELKGRSELYSIRVAKLKTDLLDAGQVRSEYLRVTNAIREVLGRSLLSKAERTDALGQLVTVNQFNVRYRAAP